MQKTLSAVIRKWKIAFQCLSISVHKAPNFLVFESFPWLSIVQKRLVELLPMILQALLAFDSDLLRVMPLILNLRIFLVVQSEAYFQRWNLHSWNVEIIPYMIYQLEQYPWTSMSIRWASAALFFQLKQKIKTSRKCCLGNTKFDISNIVKIKVFETRSDINWILLADV